MKVCIIGSYAKALVMTTQRIPIAGETLIGTDYRGTFGGKGSDMAVQAARLGVGVSYIGVIGDDAFGKEFIDLMDSEKIDISGLRITKSAPTGTGFIIKDTSAKNIIVVAPGANNLFNKVDINEAEHLINEADVVLAQLEIPLETALYAMKIGKKHGKITILNPAPAKDLSKHDLSDVDILTPNETEARIAAGLDADSDIENSEVAAHLLKTGCKYIIMTLGDKGAGVFSKDKCYDIAPYRIKVTDSNGAGDCFNASLAASLAMGKTLTDSVHYANATAALCCTKWETVPSYHTKEQVDEFIKDYKGGSSK